jgi:hypothetical protein
MANMITLLILDGAIDTRYNPLYRGTYRAHPTHCDSVTDDEEINQLFLWFIETGGQLGVVHDLSKALRFAELWNARLPEADRFEVVEATLGNNPPLTIGTFMGFDLSSGYNNSLLSTGLELSTALNKLPEPIRNLCALVSVHYAPLLNRQGLFETFEVASSCLRSMVALQDLSPNLFEGGDLREFRPVALYTLTGLPR